MGTGYTRNDTANNIADGNIINASDLDGEFDAVQSAFNASTGHTHDGTAGEGAPIETIGPSQDVVATASVLRPKTDNTVDLGTTSLEYKDLFLDGTAHIDTLDVDENASITGTLGVTGTTTLGTANITTGTITTADINGGNIDGTIIGATTAAAITGTTITGTSFVTSGDMTFGDNDKAIFGAGSDLQIYHDGTHSYINEAGTGNLRIRASAGVFIQKHDGTEALATFLHDDGVYLYHNNNLKFQTTSTGIDVTGTITADGLTVDGASSLNADITQTAISPSFYMMDSNTTDLNDRFVNAGGTIFLQTVNDAKNTFKSRISANNSTGDISFYEDTGTTAKLFWDASAESLGIGTSSPTDKLNISSGSNQIGLDTGDQATYGTLDLGHFTNGAFIGTQAGTNAASNLLRFGTSGTERMRIDSSGNLLVGTTDVDHYATSTNQGMSFRADFGGLIASTRSNNYSGVFNRIGTDGDILNFRKDGTTVGSIGTLSGNVTIGTGDTGVQFNQDTNAVMPHNISTGANVDASIDLGYSSGGTNRRFKDLYLSGGVYLGGTGSANLLDDYEEGTWTPTYEGSTGNPTVTYGTRTGYYVKVGHLVYVNFDIDASSISGGSGSLRIGGLPFNVDGSTNHYPTVYFRLYSAVTLSSNHYLTAYMQDGHISLQETQLDNGDHTGLTTFDASGRIAGTAMYYSV